MGATPANGNHVMKTVSLILMLLSTACIIPLHARNNSDEDVPKLSIEFVMDNQQIYERQPVPVVLTLRSSTPDIAFATPSGKPGLKKGEYSTFQIISEPGPAYVEKVNGNDVYCFPLEAYMISVADKGSYELTDDDFIIGISYPVVVNDPFWGPRRSSEVRKVPVSVTSKSFKVKPLPKIPQDFNFSGSVGDFTIETVIPEGDIFINEEATAYIILRGKGMIEEATLPSYTEAFTNGVQLKSVTESRDEAYDGRNKTMMSEIRLECTFIPTVRNGAEIGEVTLGYFDPEAGEYKMARSKPVTVTVKSSAAKRESMSI